MSIPGNHQRSLVIFVHGSRSSVNSLSNEHLSRILNESGIATLLIDLLTNEETEINERTREFKFNLRMLTKRLVMITDEISENNIINTFSLGYLGSSTGAAIAIQAASNRPSIVKRVVYRLGRVDLVGWDLLKKFKSWILLLAGDKDISITDKNFKIYGKLNSNFTKKMILISGASHLFQEHGKIKQVGRIAAGWLKINYLRNKIS